ncbi:MAG: Ig-like domain repeat protein [Candidatus Sulfotelmatobacter sp.]
MARKSPPKVQVLRLVSRFLEVVAVLAAVAVPGFRVAASASPRPVVNSTTKSVTSTTLGSSLNPSVYGQSITWTATVTTSGPVAPTGKVTFQWQFFTETYTVGSGTLNSNGVATLTKSNFNADTYTLTAVYSGDVNNLGSTSLALNQVVSQAASAATVAAFPNPSTIGGPATFSATITSPTLTPTGPVTFLLGKTVLGTAQLSRGEAKFSTSSLPEGSNLVTATYYGDSNVAESSASVTQEVEAAGHDTWTSGAPVPKPVWASAVGLLNGEIYLVGGVNADNTIIADTQIYNPATNTWRTGVPLPTRLEGACGAVVNNVLYVMGGAVDGVLYDYSSAVWAFDPNTNAWSAKSAMPTALHDAGVAVENDIIYLVGGNSPDNLRATTVQSYNPASDTWTEEAPLLVGRSEPSVGVIGTTIVAADGYASGGDTEGYDATTNTWTTLKADPVPGGSGWRSMACTGSIGTKLYIVGGYYGGSLNESFTLPEDTWETLASMPQAAMETGSAVYNGRLYCLGGTVAYWAEGAISNVQIYQP